MKKLIWSALVIGAGIQFAAAHEMKGGSTEGLFGLKPEYLHILLNPIPVYGLGIGLVLLLVGLLKRHQSLRTAGLIVSFFAGASAWPVLFFGQRGYNSLFPMLDTDSQGWLNTHMNRAEGFIWWFYATALIAVLALALNKKFPRMAIALAVLTLFVGGASLGIGGWISRAGGQVSHSEFRSNEETSQSATTEQQQHVHSQKNEKETK